MMGKIGYKLAPELADKTLNPEYNVTVANNIITIPAHIAMADKYGTVTMIIEIPDTTDNMAYTYSCNYIVDKNLAYTANLNTRNLAVVMRDTLDNYKQIPVNNELPTVNTIEIQFAEQPVNNQYEVTVIPMIF